MQTQGTHERIVCTVFIFHTYLGVHGLVLVDNAACCAEIDVRAVRPMASEVSTTNQRNQAKSTNADHRVAQTHYLIIMTSPSTGGDIIEGKLDFITATRITTQHRINKKIKSTQRTALRRLREKIQSQRLKRYQHHKRVTLRGWYARARQSRIIPKMNKSHLSKQSFTRTRERKLQWILVMVVPPAMEPTVGVR
jgi:hypothetical protein